MMAGFLPLDTILILWLGALLGGIAAGGSGFAFGLAASSIWLHRIDPLHSAILITGCGLLLHRYGRSADTLSPASFGPSSLAASREFQLESTYSRAPMPRC